MDNGDPPPLRLLLVDDDPRDLDLIRQVLADTGIVHELDIHSDCKAAFEALLANQHDICLLDTHLKFKTGLELFLAAREQGSRVPIILLSPEGCAEDERAARSHGVVDYLPKNELMPKLLACSLRLAYSHARHDQAIRAEQAALARANAELKRLKDTLDAHAIVSVADVHGNITYVNDQFCQVSGYAQEELIGRNHRILKSGLHDAAFYEDMWHQLANGQTWQGDVCNRRKDGSHYWVRGTIVPFAGSDGLPYQYVSIRTDVTLIKQSEEKLRLFGKALEASVDGIAIADACQDDTPLIYVNPAFQQMTGYSREDLLGRNCRFLQGAEAAQLGLAEIRAAIAGKRPGRALLRNYRKDGQLFWNDFSISPVLDDHGQVSHFIGVANDVTARQEAEAALHQSEERLRRSQVYANIGTWDWNIKTGDLYWSERIGPLFGYEGLVETTYENFLAAVHPEDRQLVIDAVNACVGRGEKYEVEHRVVWPDGSVRWMLERGDVTRDPDGSPAHMLGVVQDVTDRKQAQERLQASEASLANAQRIAHLGSWHLDFATGELIWSDEIYRIFGHEPGQFMPSAESFFAAVHPEDLERVRASELKARSTGIHDVVHRIIRPDGSVRHVHELAEMVTDARGLPLRMTGTVQDVTERVESEQAIRASEARLANAQRIAHLGNWDYDLTSGKIAWSEEVYRIFGFEIGRISPDIRSYYQWTHPEDRDMLHEAEARTLREGKGEVVHRIVREDGSIRYVQLIGELSRDEQGLPQRMTGTVQDITPVKQAEEAMRQSEALLRRFYELSPLGIAQNSMDGRFLQVNQALLAMTGYREKELKALSYWELTPQEYEVEEQRQLDSLMRSGRYGPYEKEYIHKDGHRFPVLLNGIRLTDAQGREVIWSIIEDISARKRTEHDLLRLAARNRALMDSAYDGILLADVEGHLIDANPRAEAITGYRRDQLLKMHASQLHPARARDQVAASFAKIRSQGSALEHIDVEQPDGTIVPVDITATLIDQDDERYILGVFRDMSERVEREAALHLAKEEAEQANQAKSMFLSSMSHELRTPLNAILGFAQLLQMYQDLTTEQSENVEEILRAGRHLLALINEVLDLAKIESGRVDLSVEPLSCCELAQECLNLVRPLAERHGIRIRQDYQVACPVWFLADRTRLKQVIVNLLSNAIKYNRPEGSVTMRILPAAAGYLRIEVVDTGLGIRAEDQAGVFQPFHRLHDVDSGIEGTGIGLSISKRLVEAMQGRIGVQSSFGAGSTFWVELPTPASEGQQPAANQRSAKALPDGSGGPRAATLLYIEDSPANVRLLERIVQAQAGWKLYTAHEPVLGLELARVHAAELDAILLDINLPGMDGYAVLQRLQADAVTAAIPVMAISANAMPGDVRRGAAAGFAAYLTKPLDLGQFHTTLKQLLPGHAQAEDSAS